MSIFICTRCREYSDSDEGADVSREGCLICVDCLGEEDDIEDERHPFDLEP